MTWLVALLGSGVVVGVGGVVTLGVFVYRLAANNRSDLEQLIRATKELGQAHRTNDDHIHALRDLQHALHEQMDQLERERAALHVARKTLAEAKQRLAHSGDSAGVAADINRSLELLAEMPNVRAPQNTDNDHG